MFQFRQRSLAPLIAILAAALISGCGSSSSAGLLSQTQSDSINSALSDVDAAVASGDCEQTASSSARLRSVVNGLPGSVDAALRSNLLDGTDTVTSNAATDCARSALTTSQSTTTTTTSQPTTSTSSSTSTSTTTQSTTPTEPTTTTQPTTTTTPDGGGGAQPGADVGGGSGAPVGN